MSYELPNRLLAPLCWAGSAVAIGSLIALSHLSNYGSKVSILGVGAAGASVAYIASEQARQTAYRARRLRDVQDQLAVQGAFDGTTNGNGGFNTPNSKSLKPFEITDLITKRDKYPHIMVVGGTGVGKTTLVEWLIDQDHDTLNTYVCSAMESNEFLDYDLVGDNFNYTEIASFFEFIQHEWVNVRKKVKGKKNILAECGFRNIVLDESRDACQNAGVSDKLTRFISMIRKWQVRIWLLGVSSTVKSLNIEGEGEIRDCLTFIRLGEHAVSHFKQLVREGIYGLSAQRAVEKFINQAGEQRFCMVDDRICFLPDLSNYRELKQHGKVKVTWDKNFANQPPSTNVVTLNKTEAELASVDRRTVFGMFAALEAEGKPPSKCIREAGFGGSRRYHSLGVPLWEEYKRWKEGLSESV